MVEVVEVVVEVEVEEVVEVEVEVEVEVVVDRPATTPPWWMRILTLNLKHC